MTQLKGAYTTLFWCGEGANADNKEITNIESYWCDNWVSCFGGVDHREVSISRTSLRRRTCFISLFPLAISIIMAAKGRR
jgi:hypothetical protein